MVVKNEFESSENVLALKRGEQAGEERHCGGGRESASQRGRRWSCGAPRGSRL